MNEDPDVPVNQGQAEGEPLVQASEGVATVDDAPVPTGVDVPATAADAQSTPAAGEAVDRDRIAQAAIAGERARIAAILSAPAASGRESLARHIALKTATPAAEAVAMLEASPKAAATGLAAAMTEVPNAEVGADDDAETSVVEDLAQSVRNAGRALRGEAA